MRILHILPHLSKGGAERQFSYLASNLVRMGHDVDVAYCVGGPDRPVLLGIVPHQLKLRSNYDPYLLWQLIRLIRRVKPDIIHTWILQMDILGGIAARLCGVPWILRESNQLLTFHTPALKKRLRVWVASFASAIVSNSSGGDKYWETRQPQSRRYVIQNGLPLADIDRANTSLPVGLPKRKAPIVLYVGRLEESQKRLSIFLKALVSVRQQQDAVGILCGEGPQRDELELLGHKLGLDTYVQFTGYLPAEAIWALMKKASVCVSLSAYEGHPNAVMEAMRCSCPLVVSDIPAHRAILDDSCALFVDPSKIQQTADAIVHTLHNTGASKARALLARQKSEGWSIDEMARNYEKVYSEIISRSLPVIGLEAQYTRYPLLRKGLFAEVIR